MHKFLATFAATCVIATGSPCQRPRYIRGHRPGPMMISAFGLENALIDAGSGYQRTHESHCRNVERTKADVGGNGQKQCLFTPMLGFCSADLSRKAMEANPLNIRSAPIRYLPINRQMTA